MSKINQKLQALLALHSESVGSRSLLRLKQRFGSYEAAAKASNEQLTQAGLSEKQQASMKERVAILPRILEIIEKYNIRLLELEDLDYPLLLKEMADPPVILYVRGSLAQTPTVSIVGSRKYTTYGQSVTQEVSKTAASLGLTVVSGLALGIDSIAHRAALAVSGRTLGVLACGVEQVYPTSHYTLAETMIASGGGLVSEFPLFTPPYRSNFPVRNRIIAGLSRATIVTEAGLGSGALITAQLAIEYNRDVFAVPADIFKAPAAGSNALLAAGAIPLTQPDVLADYYNIAPTQKREPVKLTGREQGVVEVIPKEGAHLDNLAEALDLDIASLTSIVIMLEIKGVVKHEGAGVYRRVV